MVTYSSWVTIFWSIFDACCMYVNPFFSGFEAEKGLRVIHACVVYTAFYGSVSTGVGKPGKTRASLTAMI